MSSKISKFVLATIIMFSGVSASVANDSVKVNSTSYLSAGSAFNFKVYMNQKAKRFVKNNENDWAAYNKAVLLYTTSTGKFLKMSEQEKEAFLKSAKAIEAKLDQMKAKDAKKFKKQVELTEKVFKFIWDSKIENSSVEKYFEIQPVKFENTVGR